MSGKKPILCVIGPTASGKTAAAVTLAKEHSGEVISVDSRQVYRTLDIGTEKVTPEEMQGVPHHLIDIRDPEESYSAGDFVTDAARLIEEIRSRGKTPILAGGTHFYFDALLNGLPAEVAPNAILRAELETKSDEDLLAEIEERDPERAAELDPKNRRRLIRALEILAPCDTVPRRTHNEAYEVEWHVMLPPRDELREKIVKRLEAALSRGLIEEVRKTQERVGDDRLNELGLEYRIVGEYLRGERDETSLLPALSAKLFQYARRQEAWIRKLTS